MAAHGAIRTVSPIRLDRARASRREISREVRGYRLQAKAMAADLVGRSRAEQIRIVQPFADKVSSVYPEVTPQYILTVVLRVT